jgi:hypothetical protein
MVSVAEILRAGAHCSNWILSRGRIASFVLACVPDGSGKRDGGDCRLIPEAASITGGMPLKCGWACRSDREGWS